MLNVSATVAGRPGGSVRRTTLPVHCAAALWLALSGTAGTALADGSAVPVATATPAVPRMAADPGSAGQALLQTIAGAVDPARLRATIARLVGFGTRSTISETGSSTHGIGAARRWAQAEFAAISSQCGQCLEIVTPSQVFTGERLPKPTEVMDVVAIQRGTDDAQRVILITGHIDSRNSNDQDADGIAPGANDDGSGTAAVLEAARVLSRYRFHATLVYGVLSGEEQGLYGGKVLAEYAKAQGWKVEADLNNDIIGNSQGQNGVVDNSTVRVFSEGTRSLETPQQAARRRYNGGEVDSPSRNLARFMADMADRHVPNLNVRMIYRTDRFGRGGDQVEFLAQGFPAVRVTEAHENYTRQHQDVRGEGGIAYGDVLEGVDFTYLAQVTRLNLVTLAALASAPAPPSAVGIAGAVQSDTTLNWTGVAGAVAYRVWWRDTTAPRWQFSRLFPSAATPENTAILRNVVIDDWFFGVSAISADGFESPVVFPGPPGAF